MIDKNTADYNNSQPDDLKPICDQLYNEISSALTDSNVRLYHANPVWFIDDNPIVGYDVGKDKVNVLFWSGQSFTNPGLTAKGKHKAAGTSYESVSVINKESLQSWLEESKTIQWDYKHIRENSGSLNRLL